MTELVHFTTPTGRESTGEVAVPAGDGRAAGLVVVHEWWGLNDDVRRMADRFAAAGYITLAVDIYGVPATTDPAEARRRTEAFQTPDAMDIIAGAARWLSGHARGTGKVGVTGFCLGGAMALVAACQ